MHLHDPIDGPIPEPTPVVFRLSVPEGFLDSGTRGVEQVLSELQEVMGLTQERILSVVPWLEGFSSELTVEAPQQRAGVWSQRVSVANSHFGFYVIQNGDTCEVKPSQGY